MTALITRNPITVGRRARFTVIHPNCIRIEDTPDGKFVNDPSLFAIHRDARCTDFKVTSNKSAITIDTGAIRLTYRNDGKAMGARNISAQVRHGQKWVTWKPGQRNRANLGGTAETLDGWTGSDSLGDGLLSRDGWYLLDDSKGPLQTRGWVGSRNAKSSDWYLFGYGRDYRAAFQAFAAIAGTAPMPRRYTLGSWYSRYWPYSSADYRKIVKEYTKKDFPLDVMVMDMDWHVTQVKDTLVSGAIANGQVWTGYTWDRKLLPDAEKLLKWFHDEGIYVTLNDHPADGVQPHEEMYKAFMREMKADPKSRKTIPFDAGNRKYLETFYKHTHTPLEKAGCDFWWLDWQQYRNTLSVPDVRNLTWLNHYYYRCSQQDGKRGQSFSRWGGWGDHRNPIHFSGDSNTGWRMLAFQVPFTSTAGNVGCFFWSHDIGGHQGGRNEEAYTRWCQFGALTAALRSHSTRDATMDRRPWTYEKWAEASMQKSFHLRSELFPYIYSCVAQSCQDTIPLTRPMYIDNPETEAAYHNPQEYMFGDHLLVAPITEPGIGPRRLGRQAVWFPKGAWYNVFTGERFEGLSERMVSADIDEFPLFARGGAPIPMQPYTPRMATAPVRNLIVRCWPGEDKTPISTVLHEDDGVTTSYGEGKQARTNLTYVRNGGVVTITISPTLGTFKGQTLQRAYTIELPATGPSASATVDGKTVAVKYDAATRTNRICLPSRSIRKGCTVVANVREVSPALAEAEAFARRAGLPRPGSDATLLKLIDKALAGRSKGTAELVLRALGIGLFAKVETVYGHPSNPTYYIYAPAERPMSRKIIIGLAKKGSALQLAGEKTRVDISRLTSALPVPKNEVFNPRQGVTLNACLTISGRRVEASETVFHDKPYWQFRNNLASQAKATASSCMDGQPASGAIDGLLDGYPHDLSREWASKLEKTGAWLKLEWDKPLEVGRVLLFDRPNSGDHVVAGQIVMSDGSVVPVGELPPDGQTPLVVRFPKRKIKWLAFVITSAGPGTYAIGLSEIGVYKR